MDNCTHDCSTCGGGCSCGLPEGVEPIEQRDILNELKQFVDECETEEVSASLEKMLEDLDKELNM